MPHTPPRPTVLAACLLALVATGIRWTASGADHPFADPAPPVPATLPACAPATPQTNPDATFRGPPKPLVAGAVARDWPAFLGPDHNETSAETHLLTTFPTTGPAVVWEMTRGSGYAAPAVAGGRVVLLHRVGNDEIVDCLHPETGQRYWRFAYPTAYNDRYGYCDGPRASPVIAGDGPAAAVFTVGAEGKLHCLDLATGQVRWKRDLLKEFKLKQNFFGVGSTPLVEGDKLIVNVGAPGGPCVAAFDVVTGRMAWGAGDEWGPSYASPVPADVCGRRRVFVFAGGETGLREPPTGGLLCIDPADGTVDFTFPWRGDRRESVNASTPLVFTHGGRDRVFISECYGSGGALLDVKPAADGKRLACETAWTNGSFGTHFMTAVRRGDYLYGVDGHGPNDATFVCVDIRTGKETWRTQPEWTETVKTASGERKLTTGTYRSHLMPVDGRCLVLGEFGHLLWVDLEPAGYKEQSRAWLFAAGETWSPPVLSRGLLYVCQNERDTVHGHPPRLICYDLRGP